MALAKAHTAATSEVDPTADGGAGDVAAAAGVGGVGGVVAATGGTAVSTVAITMAAAPAERRLAETDTSARVMPEPCQRARCVGGVLLRAD